MILSDRTIREELAAGRIVIDPFDETLVQPSSIDVRVDRLFRVFRNHTAGVLDVKQDLTTLTELVEIAPDGVFMLHPGEFVLGSTLERVAVPDDLVARIEGKALSVATPVPTPDGWTTIGDLTVGDVVFGDTGSPIRIKDVTEVMLGRPCSEVVFSDGSTIIADDAHEWLTMTKAQRRRAPATPAVSTTALIGATLKVGREYNHHVAIAGSVQCTPRELPIHPYVLGIWIGDGPSTKAEVTTADEQVSEEVRSCGFGVAKASGPLAWRLSSILRNAGLLGTKHIPDDYLRASIEQRWWLLEGLMDAHGDCDRWGRCEYTTISSALADQVCELACSLGFRAIIAKQPAMLNGIDHGPKYDVTFTPDRPVFRLTRKLIRQRRTGRFERFRAIVAVRRVASTPVRCIEVDHPCGMFLVGRSFIPTHNSSLGRLGLLIHSTAGFVDAGFDGHVTLELANVASLPITIYPGMKIGQISFMEMTTPADRPYGKGATGSKYQGQRGPTPSRYWENFA